MLICLSPIQLWDEHQEMTSNTGHPLHSIVQILSCGQGKDSSASIPEWWLGCLSAYEWGNRDQNCPGLPRSRAWEASDWYSGVTTEFPPPELNKMTVTASWVRGCHHGKDTWVDQLQEMNDVGRCGHPGRNNYQKESLRLWFVRRLEITQGCHLEERWKKKEAERRMHCCCGLVTLPSNPSSATRTPEASVPLLPFLAFICQIRCVSIPGTQEVLRIRLKVNRGTKMGMHRGRL